MELPCESRRVCEQRCLLAFTQSERGRRYERNTIEETSLIEAAQMHVLRAHGHGLTASVGSRRLRFQVLHLVRVESQRRLV